MAGYRTGSVSPGGDGEESADGEGNADGDDGGGADGANDDDGASRSLDDEVDIGRQYPR